MGKKKKINKSRPKSIFLYKKKINLSTQKKMAFSEWMVLKKATNMSLHERFSQMRHEKITQPAAATAPKYSAPPVRSAPPMPRSPPLPPRISDYYDDENDSDDVQITSFRNSSAQYHGLFSDKIRRRSNHQTSHSLAFQAAMQIKKKTFQNFNRIPVKQRLGLNRSQISDHGTEEIIIGHLLEEAEIFEVEIGVETGVAEDVLEVDHKVFQILTAH